MSPAVNERKPFAKDRLADYVDVKERIRLFYEKYPDGRLVTYEVRCLAEPDDVPRVWVWAKAYRTPDDPLPGDGWSWMVLPGSTPYTRGSELENTETSAWGRAIGALGIGIKGGIATTDEIASKSEDAPLSEEPVLEQMSPLRDGLATLHGTVGAGKTPATDIFLRQTPTGYALGFVLISETRGRTQVLARDLLAQDIWDAIGHDAANLYNREVTVEGELTHVPWEKDGRAMKPYKQLALRKLTTPEWVLPDEPPEEAESMALFDSEPVA